MSAPAHWSVLRNEDGEASLVVPEGTDVVEALLTLVEEEYGGGPFARDNPAIVDALEAADISVWRRYSPERAVNEGICEDDQSHGWWGPSGDLGDPITVLVYDGDPYSLGEEAEAAEAAPAGSVQDTPQ